MRTKIIFILLIASISLCFSQTTTILWDCSLSMKKRDINKDFQFLERFFQQNKNTSVTIVKFQNGIISKSSIPVTDGNWIGLKSALENTIYDGATSYKGLPAVAQGNILLFTDGNDQRSSDDPYFNGDLTVINSSTDYDTKKLLVLSTLNKGRLLNIAPLTNNLSLEYTGQIVNKSNYRGDAQISLNGKKIASIINSDGRFKINAKAGDTLAIQAKGTKSVVMELGEDRLLNIVMDSDGEQLNEVLIETKKEVSILKNDKMTAYGPTNPDALGYSLASIDDEEISEITTTLSQAARGKLVSLEYGSGQDISQSVIRGLTTFQGNNYALVVVDGVALKQSNSSRPSSSFNNNIQSTDFIDPNNIADITVLKGLAATNLYGAQGSNGVILITTKLAEQNLNAKKDTSKENTALLKNNIYEGTAKLNRVSIKRAYIQAMTETNSSNEAYKKYLNLREFNASPAFYLDTAEFFSNSNPKLASQIASNILEVYSDSHEALQALLMLSNDWNDTSLALDTANLLLERFPNQIQSYLDVAIANRKSGNYQIALDMLHKMSSGTINTQLDFSGLSKIIDNELKFMILKHRDQVKSHRIGTKYFKETKYDARLTFTWNDTDANFDLKFINPMKRFFNWEHSLHTDPERINSEKTNGYSKEEFLLIDAEKGPWLINVIYNGNTRAKDLPVYISCTVDYNFGKPEQRTEEHLLKLEQIGEEITMLNVLIK